MKLMYLTSFLSQLILYVRPSAACDWSSLDVWFEEKLSLWFNFSLNSNALRTYRCTLWWRIICQRTSCGRGGVISQSGSSVPEWNERSKVSKSVLSNQNIQHFTGEHDDSRRNRNANILSISPGLFKLQIPSSRREGRTERRSEGVCQLTRKPERTIHWLFPPAPSGKLQPQPPWTFTQFTCTRPKLPNLRMKLASCLLVTPSHHTLHLSISCEQFNPRVTHTHACVELKAFNVAWLRPSRSGSGALGSASSSIALVSNIHCQKLFFTLRRSSAFVLSCLHLLWPLTQTFKNTFNLFFCKANT